MKILVTGGTGFVGKYVLENLMKTSNQIFATTSNLSNIDKKNYLKEITFIEFDLDKTDETKNYFEYFEQPDLLIHLAWQGLPNYKSLFHFEKNLPAHYFFLKNIIVNGLKNIAITGTCFEYGMKEGCLKEDLITDPQNPYALAKDTLRKFLVELKRKHEFDCKWIRLFYMYGKGQSPNSLFSQLEAALENGDKVFNMSGGEQVRDFLPVETVAEYIVKIALQNKITGIINCCSGQPVTVKTFVEKYLENKNKKIELNLGYYPYTDFEAMQFWGDDSKLKTIIKNE